MHAREVGPGARQVQCSDRVGGGGLACAGGQHACRRSRHSSQTCHAPLPSLQIFFEERWDDILAANPALFAHGLADRKALLSAASIYWCAPAVSLHTFFAAHQLGCLRMPHRPAAGHLHLLVG